MWQDKYKIIQYAWQPERGYLLVDRSTGRTNFDKIFLTKEEAINTADFLFNIEEMLVIDGNTSHTQT